MSTLFSAVDPRTLPPSDDPNPCIGVHASENPRSSITKRNMTVVDGRREVEGLGAGREGDGLADIPSRAAKALIVVRATPWSGPSRSRVRSAARKMTSQSAQIRITCTCSWVGVAHPRVSAHLQLEGGTVGQVVTVVVPVIVRRTGFRRRESREAPSLGALINKAFRWVAAEGHQ